jgi:hypothetical protein
MYVEEYVFLYIIISRLFKRILEALSPSSEGDTSDAALCVQHEFGGMCECVRILQAVYFGPVLSSVTSLCKYLSKRPAPETVSRTRSGTHCTRC